MRTREADCFFSSACSDGDVGMVQRDEGQSAGVSVDNCLALDVIESSRRECAITPRTSERNRKRNKIAETKKRDED